MAVFTKEDGNIRRYYHALLASGDTTVPSSNDFMPFGAWSDISVEMFSMRAKNGVEGLKQYVTGLSNMRDKQYKRLIKILSSESLEATVDPYTGILLSEVKAINQTWLWKPRLALGKITTFDGDPGLGKSLIGVDIGARITRGKELPDGSPCLAQGGVVIIMPEDGLEDTIQPRFARAGADLSKVTDLSVIKDDEGEHLFNLASKDDLASLEAAIKRVDAKLVYIDPIMAVIGGDANTYKDNEVRAMLMPLKMLVERCKVSCVVVRHMVKTRGDNPLMAGGGSIAFVGLARTGLMVIRNPHDRDQTIFSHIKSNIGPLGPGISYSVVNDEEEGDDRPYVAWGEVSALSALALMSTPHKNTGNNRQAILSLLQENSPEEMSVQEIHEALPEITVNNIRVTLTRLHEKGEVEKSERDSYYARG